MMANITDVTARLVRASLIGALVGSALPAFNGFTRFAHPQTALAVVGLCPAVAFAAKRAFGSGEVRVGAQGMSSAGAWLIASCAALVTSAVYASGDASGAASWVALPALAACAAALAPTGRAEARGVFYAASALGLLAALLSILQVAGTEFPAAIPEVTWPSATPRGLWDAPVYAGGAITMLALLAGLAGGPSVPVSAIALGALGAAAGWHAGPWAAAPLLAAAACSARDTRALPLGAAALAAALVGALAPATYTDAPEELHHNINHLRTDQDWPADDAGAAGVVRAAMLQAVADTPAFGHGPGNVAGALERALDHDDPWMVERFDQAHEVDDLPSLAARWWVEFGFAVPLFALLALLLPALRTRAMLAPALSGAVAFLFLPGLGAPTALLALGLLPLAAASEEEPGMASNASAALLPAIAIAVGVLVVQVKTLRWSYEHAVGVQLADAGRLDLAREAFVRANDAQRRYATRINLGTLTNYLQGDDPPDAEGPLTAFRDAVDMRPSASLPRVRLADSYIRGTEGEGDTPDERTQRTIEMLNRAIDIDPNHVEAALMRADLYLLLLDAESAAETLHEMAQRPLPPAALERLEWARARAIDRFLEDPETALAAYERVMELTALPRRQAEALMGANRMREWLDTGRRPAPTYDGHEGHDHGVDLTGGGHDHGHDDHGHGEHGHEGEEHPDHGHGGHGHEGEGYFNEDEHEARHDEPEHDEHGHEGREHDEHEGEHGDDHAPEGEWHDHDGLGEHGH